MRRVAIIDYGLCNIDSVQRAISLCGDVRAEVLGDPDEIRRADLLVLPGVGHFAAAMQQLEARGIAALLREVVPAGKPLLGICLGMQLLAERSEEGDAEGLGLIPGEVTRMRGSGAERVPHIGWNRVDVTRDDPLFAKIEPGRDFYFVHSYRIQCRDPRDVLARTPYCGGVESAVRRGSAFGTQFHPEKSWPSGGQLLANFAMSA